MTNVLKMTVLEEVQQNVQTCIWVKNIVLWWIYGAIVFLNIQNIIHWLCGVTEEEEEKVIDPNFKINIKS